MPAAKFTHSESGIQSDAAFFLHHSAFLPPSLPDSDHPSNAALKKQTPIRKAVSLFLVISAGALFSADAPPVVPGNLAREQGATAIGSGSNGPFAISKLNDGRMQTLGMWSSDNKDGAFGGIKLGASPVNFNTVRFYLFNERAAFTGWRLEGSDDVEIDDDPDPGVSPGFAMVHEQELIAADPEGQFVNAGSKEHNTVTITFSSTKYQAMLLVFPKLPQGSRASVGVPEMEVFNKTENATPRATLTGKLGTALDNLNNTITVPKPVTVSELISNVVRPSGVTVFAHDAMGKVLPDTGTLGNGCTLMAKFQTGGEGVPFETEYKCYSIVDSSAPPPAPKPPKAPRAPRPPKPLVSIASAPDAPKDAANLILGKTITGSIRPESADKFIKSGAGDWFLTQQIPQWISVDFGAKTEFNYFGLASAQAVHFAVQTSNDAETWTTLVEVDRVRPPYQWNGYFEKTAARHLRLVILKPSWDVHIRKLTVANLSAPLLYLDGKQVPALKPVPTETLNLDGLPKAAVPEKK